MKNTLWLTTIALSLSLVGCGGGGGSTPVAVSGSAGGQVQAVVPPQAPTITPANLQTTVAAATYVVGSDELAYYTAINDFRSKLGLGLLAQSAALDTASKNHASYIAANPTVDYSAVDATGSAVFHKEDPAKSGFTGVTPTDRAAFASYGSIFVGEEGSIGTADGSRSAKGLINSVFHREGLMGQSITDLGVSFVTSATLGKILVNNPGYKTAQTNASDYLGVYPANSQTGLPLAMVYETPSPFADVSTANYQQTTSSPISVSSVAGSTLSVAILTVTEVGTAAPLDMRVVSNATNPAFIPKSSVYYVGKAPFKANTVYNVVFSGTVNGANVSKTWAFTTGATNQGS